MAASQLLVFFAFLALLFTGITADPPAPNDGVSAFGPEVAESPLALLLEQLKTKVSLLESKIDSKNWELRRKDESIRQMERILQETSHSIALLDSEIESVQGKYYLDSLDITEKSEVQTGGLEKQVKRLTVEIIIQNKKKDELEARASIAEQKIWELNLKLENLQKVNDEQKTGIRKTEHDLDVTEVRGGWLPYTFSVHISFFQSFIVTYWNKLGRPALDVGIEKVLEVKAEVEDWAELNIERIRTKWIPILKKKSLAIMAFLEPNIQLVTAKTVDLYHSSKSFIARLVFKAQKMADPYIQEAKRYSEPYIDHVSLVSKPLMDKLHVLKPCAEKLLHAYRKLISSATFYHYEVEEMLKNNELTQPLASIDLAWFAATALLALPAVFLSKLYLAIFRKKSKKRNHSSHGNFTHRMLKRPYPEK